MARLIVIFFLAVAFSAATLLAGAADFQETIQLPRSLYKSIAGGWNVDLYSPCGGYTSGTVDFANETAVVHWADAEWELLITPHEDTKAMDISGVQRFVRKDATKEPFSYRICERAENTVETPRRPGLGATMGTTYLYDFSGTFETTGADPCKASDRPVHIRVMGNPLVTSLFASEQKGQVQYLEVTLDTSSLPDTCSSTRRDAEKAAAAPMQDGTSARARKRRGTARHTARSVSAASSETTDASVPNGVLVMRFAMSTPPPKTMLQRASPLIVFACMFVILRIVYGFASAKAAKS